MKAYHTLGGTLVRLVKRTLLALFLGALIALLPAALAVTPDDYAANAPEKLTPEHLYGLSCILVNADTGEVLLEKDADSKRYPRFPKIELLIFQSKQKINT